MTTEMVVMAIIVACMATIIFFTVKGNLQMQKELTGAEAELARIQSRMEIMQRDYLNAVKDSSWLRGRLYEQGDTEEKEEEHI